MNKNIAPAPRLVRISKREAQKRFNANLPILVCPCKLRPDGPFASAWLIFGKEYNERAKNPYSSAQNGWELMYNEWRHFNASHETGYYAHYYIEI